MSEQFDRDEFDRLAAEFRYVITDMICRAGSGHLGGALSLVEIVISLYWRIMRYDPANPKWPDPSGDVQGPCRTGALHGAGLPRLLPEGHAEDHE